MDNQEIAEFMEAAATLNSMNLGKMAAMEAITSTLLATLCRTFPPMTAVLRENLLASSPHLENGMGQTELDAFRQNIAKAVQLLDILQEN